MKTVYKFLVLSVMMAAFVLANTSSGFAQEDDEKAKLYTDFIGCYKETDAAKSAACYAIAKQYLDKFGSIDDQYTTFVKKKYDDYIARKGKADLNNRFNNAVKDASKVNIDEAYSSGREIFAQNPDLIDVPIVLASIGFDNAIATTPNDKYNNDAINNAKKVIQLIEAGKPSVTGNYGVFGYNYKSSDPAIDSKNNTLGWMNYIIGYITYYRMNQKQQALPYLYKATQFNSTTKSNPEIYRTIGSLYVDEFIRLDKERVDKIAAAGNVDTDETKALLALQRGYADRAVDAYARAYKVASNDPKDKAYKDSLLARAKELYAIRYDNDMSGFDTYISGLMNKPFVDPTTAVTPIVLDANTTAAPATTPSPTKMTNTSTTPTTNSARPASASSSTVTSTTPAAKTTTTTTTTKTPTSTTTTTTTKTPATPAKKPAAKPKGNR